VAGLEPVAVGLAVGAEGEAGEQRGGRDLRGPVICRGKSRIDATAADLVEDLLRLGGLAWLLEVENERAAWAHLDQLGEARGRLTKAGQMRAINDGSNEGHRFGIGGKRRRGQEQRQRESCQGPSLHSSFALLRIPIS